MSDLQATIMEWHKKTFSGRRPLATAKKLLEEASECHVAAKNGDLVSMAEEAADCAIVCFVLADMAGKDLESLIHAKLGILAERTDQKERDRERGIE